MAAGGDLSIQIWRNYVEATVQRSNRRFWLRWCWCVLLWVACGLAPIVDGDVAGDWRVVGIAVFAFFLFLIVVEAATRLRYRDLRGSNS
jgi:uncharacterized membrane protein YhaH (DUF805 family)